MKKQTEVEKQISDLLQKNYAKDILSALIQYSEGGEQIDMLHEMAFELSCNGYIVFKPQSVKEREKTIEAICVDLSFNDTQERLFV
jgi:hypothetical protein